MTGRERVLAALDGGEPDRVPLAIAFYALDGAVLAPPGIRAEVRTRLRTLGRAGLVLCPACDVDEPDVPWANVAAFLEAGRCHRRSLGRRSATGH